MHAVVRFGMGDTVLWQLRQGIQALDRCARDNSKPSMCMYTDVQICLNSDGVPGRGFMPGPGMQSRGFLLARSPRDERADLRHTYSSNRALSLKHTSPSSVGSSFWAWSTCTARERSTGTSKVPSLLPHFLHIGLDSSFLDAFQLPTSSFLPPAR